MVAFQSVFAVALVLSTGAIVGPSPATASLDALCEGLRFATLPHPDDCRQYVVCSQGKATARRCPKDHVFNPTVLFCVLESQFPCVDAAPSTSAQPPYTSTEPSTSVASTTTVGSSCAERPTWESFFCQDGPGRSLVANPMNCTQYISCREGDPPRNNHCPPGTVFSDPYQDCLPGDSRACTMATVDERFCVDRPDGSYAHPAQCNRFVSCVRGQTLLEACPPFFVFDPVVAHCVQGNAVSCSQLLKQ